MYIDMFLKYHTMNHKDLCFKHAIKRAYDNNEYIFTEVDNVNPQYVIGTNPCPDCKLEFENKKMR
jgi:hypothetical protein